MKKQVKMFVVLLAMAATLQAVLSYAGTSTPEQELKAKILEFVQEEGIRLESGSQDESEKREANALLTKLGKMALDGVRAHEGEPGP
jgi:accessory colonization factor AcfC